MLRHTFKLQLFHEENLLQQLGGVVEYEVVEVEDDEFFSNGEQTSVEKKPLERSNTSPEKIEKLETIMEEDQDVKSENVFSDNKQMREDLDFQISVNDSQQDGDMNEFPETPPNLIFSDSGIKKEITIGRLSFLHIVEEDQ